MFLRCRTVPYLVVICTSVKSAFPFYQWMKTSEMFLTLARKSKRRLEIFLANIILVEVNTDVASHWHPKLAVKDMQHTVLRKLILQLVCLFPLNNLSIRNILHMHTCVVYTAIHYKKNI